MTTLIDTSFPGADEDPLSQGGAFAIRTGGIRRVGNQAANSTASVFSLAYHDATYPDDHEATMYVATVGGRDFGPAVRVSAAGAYFMQNVGGSSIFVYYWNGGGFAEVGNVLGTYAVGKAYTLRVLTTAAGEATLRVYEDGVQLGADIVTTTFFLASGKAGISGYDGTWRASRFVGADLAAGGPTFKPQYARNANQGLN